MVVTEQDVTVLLDIADMTTELIESFGKLATDEWMQAEQRIAEIEGEIGPLLDEYKARWGVASADERCPGLAGPLPALA